MLQSWVGSVDDRINKEFLTKTIFVDLSFTFHQKFLSEKKSDNNSPVHLVLSHVSSNLYDIIKSFRKCLHESCTPFFNWKDFWKQMLSTKQLNQRIKQQAARQQIFAKLGSFWEKCKMRYFEVDCILCHFLPLHWSLHCAGHIDCKNYGTTTVAVLAHK